MAAESHAEVCFMLNLLIRAMVDSPDAVSVTASLEASGKVMLKAEVAPRDVGKLIGLQGRTSRSLRVILATISKAQHQQYLLDIDRDTSPSLL
jgi:predicted RNA-binding protein YlqC (UPF0109 family)